MTKPQKSDSRRRKKCVSVRLSDIEHSRLHEVAAHSGLRMGAFIRKAVLGNAGERAQKQPPLDRQLLAQLLAQMGRIGGNVNQLAKRANIDGYGSVSETEFKEAMAAVSDMRAMLLVALRQDAR